MISKVGVENAKDEESVGRGTWFESRMLQGQQTYHDWQSGDKVVRLRGFMVAIDATCLRSEEVRGRLALGPQANKVGKLLVTDRMSLQETFSTSKNQILLSLKNGYKIPIWRLSTVPSTTYPWKHITSPLAPRMPIKIDLKTNCRQLIRDKGAKTISGARLAQW